MCGDRRLNYDAWGKGFATEGARFILRGAFEEIRLEEVYSFTTPGNMRSRRVMEKLGLRRAPERDFEHPYLPAGHPLRQHIVHMINRPLWDAISAR